MKSKQGEKNTKMTKKQQNIPVAKQQNKDTTDDVSEEVPNAVAKKAGKKTGKVKQNLLKKLKEESEEEKMDLDEEMDNSENDDEDIEDDSDEDNEEEEDDDDEEDTDDDDDEESDDDDDDDKEDTDAEEEDDEEEDSEEDDDEEEKDSEIGQKRKATKSLKKENKKTKLDLPSADVKTLFVRTGSSDIESSVIEKFFSNQGITVQQVRRLSGRNFAYVDVSESQLDAALKLSGRKMEGKQVQVLLANDKSENEKTTKTKLDEDSKKRTLFAKNLPYNASDADLKAHFPLAVKITAKRKMNGNLFGFAFVEFESEAVAEKVIGELQNSKIKGRTICLDYVGDKRLNTKPEREPDENCKTLCVKQLSYKVTKQELIAVFKKAIEARIVANPVTEKSKGFGFVVFDSHEDAEKALNQMQGKILKGRNMVISFAFKKKSKPGKDKDSGSEKKKKNKVPKEKTSEKKKQAKTKDKVKIKADKKSKKTEEDSST